MSNRRHKVTPKKKHPQQPITSKGGCPQPPPEPQPPRQIPCDLKSLKVKTIPVMTKDFTGAGTRDDGAVRTFEVVAFGPLVTPKNTLITPTTIQMVAGRRYDMRHACVDVNMNTDVGFCKNVEHPFGNLNFYEYDQSYHISREHLQFPVWVKPRTFHKGEHVVNGVYLSEGDSLGLVQKIKMKLQSYIDCLCSTAESLFAVFSETPRLYWITATACGARDDGLPSVTSLAIGIKIHPADQFHFEIETTEGIKISREGKYGKHLDTEELKVVEDKKELEVKKAWDKEEEKKESIWGEDERITEVPITVKLTRNAVDDETTIDFSKTLVTILNLFRKAPCLISRILDYKVQVGWGGDLSISILKGKFSADWGWREWDDERAFIDHKYSVALTIVEAEGEISFGLALSLMHLTFEVVGFFKLTGKTELKVSYAQNTPDPPKSFREGASFKSENEVKAQGGVRLIIASDRFIKAGASIHSGIAADAEFHIHQEYGFYMDYVIWFKGLWATGEATALRLGTKFNYIFIPEQAESPWALGRLPADSYLKKLPRRELETIRDAIGNATRSREEAAADLQLQIRKNQIVLGDTEAKLAATAPDDPKRQSLLEDAEVYQNAIEILQHTLSEQALSYEEATELWRKRHNELDALLHGEQVRIDTEERLKRLEDEEAKLAANLQSARDRFDAALSEYNAFCRQCNEGHQKELDQADGNPDAALQNREKALHKKLQETLKAYHDVLKSHTDVSAKLSEFRKKNEHLLAVEAK